MENQEYNVIEQDHYLDHDTHEAQMTFYRKTYAHTAGAFIVFLLLEYLFLNSETIVNIGLQMTQGWTWLIVLGVFMFATSHAERMVANATTIGQQYLGYFIYILMEAFIFVPLLYIGMAVAGMDILLQAFYMTLALFIGLSLIVFMTKKDFSFMRNIITIGGFIAMGLIVVGMLFGFNLGLWFSVGMVALAGGAILYQTSNMVHKYHRSQYVIASLGLFASFMLLLWYVIQIFLSRD